MNQLCEYVTLINEPLRPVISVSRIILFIINIIKKVEILEPVINIQEIDFGDKEILLDNFNKCICRLSQFDSFTLHDLVPPTRNNRFTQSFWFFLSSFPQNSDIKPVYLVNSYLFSL